MPGSRAAQWDIISAELNGLGVPTLALGIFLAEMTPRLLEVFIAEHHLTLDIPI